MFTGAALALVVLATEKTLCCLNNNLFYNACVPLQPGTSAMSGRAPSARKKARWRRASLNLEGFLEMTLLILTGNQNVVTRLLEVA